MNEDRMTFNRGAVRPMECLRLGWQLIKDDYWLFLGITVVGAILGSAAPLALLVGPAMCGIHICLLRQQDGMRVTFDMFFEGFNYFLQSLIATMIMVVPVFLVVIILYALFGVGVFAILAQQPQGRQPGPEVFWSMIGLISLLVLMLILTITVIQALFLFTYPLIVDRGLSGFEAVRMSFRAVFGNFTGVIGLIVMEILLSLAGVMACYIGAFLVTPLTYAIISVAYRQVFPAPVSRGYLDEFEPSERDSPRAGPIETGIQSEKELPPSKSTSGSTGVQNL